MEAPEIVILSEVWKAQAGVGGTEMEQELAAGIWKVFHLGLRGRRFRKAACGFSGTWSLPLLLLQAAVSTQPR